MHDDLKKIFGMDFIGKDELSLISHIQFDFTNQLPPIGQDSKKLSHFQGTHILILAIPTLINGRLLSTTMLKSLFGDQFYNQDWYENEAFMEASFEAQWLLLPKNLSQATRGKLPSSSDELLSAVLVAYGFLIYRQLTGIILWPNDYIWCSDTDSNNDRVYVGRYYDPLGINKCGFSIHRHLSIKSNYGWF